MFNKIYQGDCIQSMKRLPDETIDCCVTSPPYWGLRDYGHDDQIGLEETPEEYVSKMVAVFHEVKRVLKPEGTLWINLGDSYSGSGKGRNPDGTVHVSALIAKQGTSAGTVMGNVFSGNVPHGTKPKDLVGIPWLVAFALRADGWYLRQDIIWHKPNPMPESVTDRCTKAHEYIFLLSKAAKYYYDAEAIAEKTDDMKTKPRSFRKNGGDSVMRNDIGCNYEPRETRNKRSVWSVTTKPYSEAHFATYPEELITPCILAGCPENGVVLDPFMGSGTTAVVAVKHGRRWVGCELNADYIDIAEKRIGTTQHNQDFYNSQISVFDLQRQRNTTVT